MNCYAETLSNRNPGLLGIWGDGGTRVVASEKTWADPLRWNEQAREAGKVRYVFCASLADVFEGWSGSMSSYLDGNPPLFVSPDDRLPYEERWVAEDIKSGHDIASLYNRGFRQLTMGDVRFRLFELVRRTPWLVWQILTKRPQNIGQYMSHVTMRGAFDRFPNVHFGTSAGSQKTWDAAVPQLLHHGPKYGGATFVSAEPLLEQFDMGLDQGVESGGPQGFIQGPVPDQIIIGGESGPGARQCRSTWIGNLVEQCRSNGVRCFVKQMGSNYAAQVTCSECEGLAVVGKDGSACVCAQYGQAGKMWAQQHHAADDRKGGDWTKWPERFRLRQRIEVDYDPEAIYAPALS